MTRRMTRVLCVGVATLLLSITGRAQEPRLGVGAKLSAAGSRGSQYGQIVVGTPPTVAIIRSGYIPSACFLYAAMKSPFLLDCWLEQFPRVANAMVWQGHGVNYVPPKAWPDWPDWRKNDLREAYVAAIQWHDGGMTTYTGTPVDDVPANLEAQWIENSGETVLDEHSAAWPLYVAHLAFSMAAELRSWVNWSLRDYNAGELGDLFHASYLNMFQYDAPPYTHTTGYAVIGNATPTHPTVTFKFLAQNHLIGPTARATIANVLNWARWNLSHFEGAPDWDNVYSIWQYRGQPPVARVLTGTVAGNNVSPHHWTEGCYGTTDFLKWVLRVANIPVERLGPSDETCGHTLPYFPGEAAYLSHGDDPYDAMSKASIMSADLLLVDAQTWHGWFQTGNITTSCNNVGRRPLELAVWYLPDYLVGQYCADVIAGRDHAHGSVYDDYQNIYTVQMLESADLWTRLALKVPTTTAYQCYPLQMPH